MKCDFCSSDHLTLKYTVPSSLLGAEIYQCECCGLVQSVYNKDKSLKHTNKSISCDANWGNIRHGKKIRLNKSLEILSPHLENITSVLDIGSNRGHFVNYIKTNYPDYQVVGIEPDTRITEAYNPNVDLQHTRIEHFPVNAKYDLIYCCHTLEHVDSASDTLKKIKDLMSPNGYFYLDIPSLGVLGKPDTVEEFFIDKHTYHFDSKVLINYLNLIGFEILYKEDDGFNIVFLCKLKSPSSDLFQTYFNNKENNRVALKKVAQQIEQFESPIMLYGASKIYDALIRLGGLSLDSIDYVVDDYLQGYINDAHGKPLTSLDDLNPSEINTVVLLTRSATPDLKNKLTSIGYSNIECFNHLIK